LSKGFVCRGLVQVIWGKNVLLLILWNAERKLIILSWRLLLLNWVCWFFFIVHQVSMHSIFGSWLLDDLLIWLIWNFLRDELILFVLLLRFIHFGLALKIEQFSLFFDWLSEIVFLFGLLKCSFCLLHLLEIILIFFLFFFSLFNFFRFSYPLIIIGSTRIDSKRTIDAISFRWSKWIKGTRIWRN
jgi:hypothetical protein